MLPTLKMWCPGQGLDFCSQMWPEQFQSHSAAPSAPPTRLQPMGTTVLVLFSPQAWVKEVHGAMLASLLLQKLDRIRALMGLQIVRDPPLSFF